jgi:tRNA(Ile)-lysidine synthase
LGVASATPSSEIDEFLTRCTFPDAGTKVDCAFSGGADSTALLILATAAGLHVTAHHVDHGLRPESSTEANRAQVIAEQLGVAIVVHRVDVDPGPNLEARARKARFAALPAGSLTGHTADDQAETVLIRLLRGAGVTGLAAIPPGPTHPLLALRRHETVAICATRGIEPIIDPSNSDPAMWRNRVRHELIPLMTEIAGRDPVPVLARTADLLRDDDELLNGLVRSIDPTDARQLRAVEPALARRALRQWLTVDGYPPDAASIDRVFAVVSGEAIACEISGGRRVSRSDQHLRVEGD